MHDFSDGVAGLRFMGGLHRLRLVDLGIIGRLHIEGCLDRRRVDIGGL